jgi:hypothetical protein
MLQALGELANVLDVEARPADVVRSRARYDLSGTGHLTGV